MKAQIISVSFQEFMDAIPVEEDQGAPVLLRCMGKRGGKFVFRGAPVPFDLFPMDEPQTTTIGQIYEFRVDKVFYVRDWEVVLSIFGDAIWLVDGDRVLFVAFAYEGRAVWTEIDSYDGGEVAKYHKEARSCYQINNFMKKISLFM